MKLVIGFLIYITSINSFSIQISEYDDFINRKSPNFIEKVEEQIIEEDNSYNDIELEIDKKTENSTEPENQIEKFESSELETAYRIAEWMISNKAFDANTLFHILVEKNIAKKIIEIDSVQKKLTKSINNISRNLIGKIKLEENLIKIKNLDFIYTYTKNSHLNKKAKEKLKKFVVKSGYFVKSDKFENLNFKELDLISKKQIVNQIFYYNKLNLIKKIKNLEKGNHELINFIDLNQNFYNKTHGKKNKIKINQAIVNQYINKSEYINLMIAKYYKNDQYLVYQIISKEKIFEIAHQDWFQIVLLNLSYILDLGINEKYYAAYKLLSKIEPEFLTLDQYHRQQWTLGYISIKLGKYEEAINHFRNYSNSAVFSANKARALYWISIVYEYMMDHEKSIAYKKEAAKYPFSFYGQNAIEDLIYHKEIEKDDEEPLTVTHFIKEKINYIKEFSKNQDQEEIPNNIFFLTGIILYEKGYSGYANDFLKYFISSTENEKEKIEGLLFVKKKTSETFYKMLSIYGSKFNIISSDGTSFPVFDELDKNTLLHALVKQESGFAKGAISSKNARGLMQIIPQTAKLIANILKIKYDKYRLVVDEAYNLTIGRKYLADLLEKFNGNKILALAAYNAGPGAVQRWIDRFGDIRKTDDVDNIVEWIENIPFTETKYYVMKIIENETVYKAIIN